jgi:CBS domain-containing protein
MNRAPVTVRPELTVGEAARLLEAERRNEVPVLDAEGLLCGVVSALDLLRVLRPDAAVRPRLCTPGIAADGSVDHDVAREGGALETGLVIDAARGEPHAARPYGA